MIGLWGTFMYLLGTLHGHSKAHFESLNTIQPTRHGVSRYHVERSSGTLNRIIGRGARATATIFRAVLFTFVPTMVEFALVCGILAKSVRRQGLACFNSITLRSQH